MKEEEDQVMQPEQDRWWKIQQLFGDSKILTNEFLYKIKGQIEEKTKLIF